MIPTESIQNTTKEAYYAKFQENDRKNLTEIVKKIKLTMEKSGKKGSIIAVGGTVNKPGERKDIDLLMVLDMKGELDNEKLKITELQRANLRFEKYKEVMRNAGFNSSEIKEIPPAIDEQFQSDNILKSEGIFEIGKEGYKPIEIVCYPDDDYQENERVSILLEKIA